MDKTRYDSSDLFELIAAKLDVVEFLDLLDMEFVDLLPYLEDLVNENEDLLRKHLR